jgi:tRNA(fMet)-specific endonuclease VapC
MTFIDTCVIIDFFEGDEKVVLKLNELSQKEKLKTTAITEYELLKYKNDLKRQLAEDFLATLTVCPFDKASAAEAAVLFRKLSNVGRMVNESDLLIAGTAIANNDVLLTRDRNLAGIGDSRIKLFL